MPTTDPEFEEAVARITAALGTHEHLRRAIIEISKAVEHRAKLRRAEELTQAINQLGRRRNDALERAVIAMVNACAAPAPASPSEDTASNDTAANTRNTLQ